jgi:hypothetical protein
MISIPGYLGRSPAEVTVVIAGISVGPGGSSPRGERPGRINEEEPSARGALSLWLWFRETLSGGVEIREWDLPRLVSVILSAVRRHPSFYPLDPRGSMSRTVRSESPSSAGYTGSVRTRTPPHPPVSTSLALIPSFI